MSEYTGKLLHDYLDLLIIRLIHEHKLARDIAQTLFLSKGAVSKRLRKLEASGYIVIQKAGIIKDIQLTPEGNSLLKQFTHAGTPTYGNSQGNYLESHKIRIEALEFLIPLKERIMPFEFLASFKDIGAKAINSRGYSELVFEGDGNKYRITSKSVIIHLKERYISLDDDILQVYAQVISDLSKNADFLASRGVKMQKYTKERYKIMPLKTEIAFEHNEIANKAKDEKKEIKLFDPKDGHIRAEVDMSKGFPEFEFKHHKKAWADALNFNDTMWQLFDGRFQEFQLYVKQNIISILDLIKMNTEQSADFAKNLESHKDAIIELKTLAKNINSILSASPEQKVSPFSPSSGEGLKWTEIRKGVEILKRR